MEHHLFKGDVKQPIQAKRIMEHLHGDKQFGQDLIKFRITEFGGRGVWFLTVKRPKDEDMKTFETEDEAKKRVRSHVLKQRGRNKHKRVIK